jgi:predicted  nucleic acid-binding Zn-ribbon protein
MNQQTLPASPSLPADLLTLHHKNARGVSEVQAKVAFLNGLSRGASPGGSAANNAAIQRAILGREEAESALATAQEELSEAESRERRISERLESLLEELHGTKERQGHERSIFEKEIRKARKEAFRAGSTLVKLQEELKHSKSEVKALKDEVSAERESKEKAKQEAFERAYALAGLTEEFEVLKGKLRSLETDNHSSNLEVRAHEIRREDFGRMSLAEGDLAFLTTPRRPKRAAAGSIRSPALEQEEDEAEATPPKRPRLSDVASMNERHSSAAAPVEFDEDVLEEMKEDLLFERRRRVAAEEMVHFLNIECQFERCSCRIAESQGRRYIYDRDYYDQFQKPEIEAAGVAQAEAARVKAAEAAQAEAARVEAIEAAHAEIARLKAAEAAQAETARKQAAEIAQMETARIAAAEAAEAEAVRVHAAEAAQAEAARIEAAEKAKTRAVREVTPQRNSAEASIDQVISPQPPVHEERSRTLHPEPPTPPVHQHFEPAVKVEPTEPPKMPMPEEPVITFSPETGTFKAFPSPIRDNVRPLRFDSTPDLPQPQEHPHEKYIDPSASHHHVESFTPSGEPTRETARETAREPAPVKMPRAAPSNVSRNHSAAPPPVEARPVRRVERDAHGHRANAPLPSEARAGRFVEREQSQPYPKPVKRAPSRQEPQSQRTSHPGIPDTPINREEALAQIRARRGRARSQQRSVSATEASRAARTSAPINASATRGPRRLPNLRPDSKTENDVGERRDMSAPVRMFRR